MDSARKIKSLEEGVKPTLPTSDQMWSNLSKLRYEIDLANKSKEKGNFKEAAEHYLNAGKLCPSLNEFFSFPFQQRHEAQKGHLIRQKNLFKKNLEGRLINLTLNIFLGEKEKARENYIASNILNKNIEILENKIGEQNKTFTDFYSFSKLGLGLQDQFNEADSAEDLVNLGIIYLLGYVPYVANEALEGLDQEGKKKLLKELVNHYCNNEKKLAENLKGKDIEHVCFREAMAKAVEEYKNTFNDLEAENISYEEYVGILTGLQENLLGYETQQDTAESYLRYLCSTNPVYALVLEITEHAHKNERSKPAIFLNPKTNQKFILDTRPRSKGWNMLTPRLDYSSEDFKTIAETLGLLE